jgi:mono/diheme cytochrome c family protein
LKSFGEAGLALVVVLFLGAGFWLFSGEDLGGDDGTTPPTVIEVDTEAATRGMQLAVDKGCAACHSTDGTPLTGPTWKGLAGSSRPLESGETVTADTAYLFNSIVAPGSQVVTGFSDVMPADYADTLTEDEINDLVSYIQSLAS